ncbi:Cdc6/Cdc18 family protein [Methanococcoides methylutens]|uniref:ORC1-type DNA replication protein n=1 Tax=Methanococcoides methylutens MM1 TaxID=1434104 RepID=A0A0E3SR97_METMT|nr:AAA family ATPase [Methanococcoides methylutens]AKB84677.1 Origin of replication recognition protein / Cell division control protein 6 [Methanococcoides methylutens MM1]
MNDIFGTDGIQIFRNRAALSPRYLPDRLIGREKQVTELASLMRPVLHHGEPANVLISGIKGTGKTTVVKFLLKQLSTNIETKDLNAVPIFINCQKISTTSKIILEILNKVSPETEVPRTGLSMGKYYRALWKALNEKRTTIIVVLDEIEALKDKNVLYELSYAGENMSIEEDIFIGIIGISDDIFFYAKAENTVLSALQYRNIIFPPYSEEEVEQILNERCKIAFVEDAVDRGVVSLCTKLSGVEHDCGKALTLLERAGTIADISNEERINEKQVLLANEEMGEKDLLTSLENLPINSKLVLLSIIRLTEELTDKITTGQIEMLYRKYCEQMGTNPLGRTSVSGIVSEFDMMGIISAPVRSRGRYGKTRLVSIRKNPKKIEDILYMDYRLKEL